MPCNNYYMVYTYSCLTFPSQNIQAFIICMSTFFNTVLLILESSLQYFPCYMMSEVDHLGVFLKMCQDDHLIGISCYTDVYACRCAFVSSLFLRE